MTVDRDRVHRLVVRAPNWLGDAIMAMPALASVRQAFATAHVTIAAIPSIAPVFQEETSARQDDLLVIPDRGREIELLAGGRFDAILLLTNSFRTALAARRAGIAERWGFGRGVRRLLLTRAIARPPRRQHQSLYYLALTNGLGFEARERYPRVGVRPQTSSRAAAFLRELGIAPEATVVGFAPGAAYGHAKRWPPGRVAALIARLTSERGVTALMVGASGDRAAGREIESALPAGTRVVNAIGRTDLRLLAGVLARCAAFVSNDSGGMHLAAALGVPLVAIFGPTNERETAPLGGPDVRGVVSTPDVLTHPVFCRPCMLRECPIDHRCMTRIAPEHVFERVVAHLDRGGDKNDAEGSSRLTP